jgi:hypothetical protein
MELTMTNPDLGDGLVYPADQDSSRAASVTSNTGFAGRRDTGWRTHPSSSGRSDGRHVHCLVLWAVKATSQVRPPSAE